MKHVCIRVHSATSRVRANGGGGAGGAAIPYWMRYHF